MRTLRATGARTGVTLLATAVSAALFLSRHETVSHAAAVCDSRTAWAGTETSQQHSCLSPGSLRAVDNRREGKPMRTHDEIRADLAIWESRAPSFGTFRESVARAHLIADVEPLLAEVERLRAVALEAADLIAEWGVYAEPYFQEKWDLDGDVARIRAAASSDGGAA